MLIAAVEGPGIRGCLHHVAAFDIGMVGLMLRSAPRPVPGKNRQQLPALHADGVILIS